MRKWLVARPSADSSEAHERTSDLPRAEERSACAATNNHAAAVVTLEQLHQCVARELAVYETSDPMVKAAVYRHHAHLVTYNASEPPVTLFETRITKGDLDGVRLLLNHHVNVEAQVRGHNGLLPLAIACEHGQLAIVELLVTHGACAGLYHDSEGTPPLSAACRHGQLEVVKWLVERCALKENYRDTDSNPLVEAVRFGDQRIVKYLLDAGASTYSKTTSYSDSVWYVAVREGRFRSLRCLAEARPNDLAGNSNIWLSSLQCAIEKEDLDMAQYLLEVEALSCVNTAYFLYLAAGQGSIEIMKLLVSSGARVNKWYGVDRNPLWNAISSNQLAAVELLLSLGADVNQIALRDRCTALHVMVRYNRLDMLDAVHRICGDAADFNTPTMLNNETPLHLAAFHGFSDIVRFLLEVATNVSIRAENRYGQTALTIAARDGNIEIVRLLVQAGASVNHDIQHPLCGAAESGKFYVMQLLCESGADVLWQSHTGVSAISTAANHGRADIVEYLAEVMGSRRDTSPHYTSALSAALKMGHSKIVRMLLAHIGCCHWIGGEQQSKVLVQTMLSGRLQDVELMLRAGADVNVAHAIRITDEELCLSPLMIAAGRGGLDLAKYLCENGADVEGVSDQNETALFFAAAYGNLEVAQYLVSERNANVQSTTSYGYTPAEASFPAFEPIYSLLLSFGGLRSTRDISGPRGDRSKMRQRRVKVGYARMLVNETYTIRIAALQVLLDEGFQTCT